jgi:parallel beta-helix repeat protein
MVNKVLFEAVALTLLILTIGMIIGVRYVRVVNASPGTIVVPSPGYETIQAAINAASSGEVIEVTDGTYYENASLMVNKSVSLIGEDPSYTVIDGGGQPIAIDILSSNVVVSGFTIENGTGELPPYSGLGSGISIGRNSATIKNDILRNNYYGLQLAGSSNCMIFNDVIVNSSYAGIYFTASSNDNVFFQNTIENNTIGLYTYSPLNTFYHNNFINNTIQCRASPPVTLDNGTIQEGNYWSDYEGQNKNLTGIGDSPFVYESSFTDYYPLMGVFTNFTFEYEGRPYSLSTICNSTISNFEFNESSRSIEFDVVGLNSTVGFCRIAMPLTLILKGSTILVDGNLTASERNWNASGCNYRSFLYENTGTTMKVTVEFEPATAGAASPSFLVPALIAVLLVAIVLVLVLITVMRGNLGKKVRSKLMKSQSLTHIYANELNFKSP